MTDVMRWATTSPHNIPNRLYSAQMVLNAHPAATQLCMPLLTLKFF